MIKMLMIIMRMAITLMMMMMMMMRRRRRRRTMRNSTYAVAKRKPEKNSGLFWIRTLNLCDTGAALYQLS